jgi:riboflavin kinase/FMN adenylyltransferase
MPPAEPLFIDGTSHARDGAPALARGSVIIIGNFDGVHRGHQALALCAVEKARALGVQPVALTFEPHPSTVLGRSAPPALTTLARKAELLARLGIEHVVVRRFDVGFASYSPERFARELLAEELSARVVVVGTDFRFGEKRAGDVDALRAFGATLGFEVAPEEARDGRGPYSSSRARDAVAAGDLDEAEHVLGRRHSVSGVVGEGDKRGRTIGFPTANLRGVPELVPARGVYAVVVDRLEGGHARALGRGVMNIGVRPTVTGGALETREVHLFDLSADLYGAELRVHFVARLREERRFEGVDALKAQIAEDAVKGRALTAGVAPVGGSFG